MSTFEITWLNGQTSRVEGNVMRPDNGLVVIQNVRPVGDVGLERAIIINGRAIRQVELVEQPWTEAPR